MKGKKVNVAVRLLVALRTILKTFTISDSLHHNASHLIDDT